jgi:hypothetical protein
MFILYTPHSKYQEKSTYMYITKRGFPMAGADAERQETGLVDAINNAVKNYQSIKGNKLKGIKVRTSGGTLSSIIKAEKYPGSAAIGNEPYTDVILHASGGKQWNLSMKGLSAPSLAGGGAKGLEQAVPGLAGKFIRAAHRAYLSKGYKTGDNIPDAYGKIPENQVLKILKGTVSMGGPIHYMYIGPMDIVWKFDLRHGILSVNGKLTSTAKYAKEHELIFRMRKRRVDQMFLSEGRDKLGHPAIYGKSPSRGDSAKRVVVVDKFPKDAFKVRF